MRRVCSALFEPGFAILGHMRIVGNKNTQLNQPPVTPEEAWQRGRVLDAMLPSSLSRTRGVSRLTHAQRNSQDDARMLVIARALNAKPTAHG
jgi:hypothetical protein